MEDVDEELISEALMVAWGHVVIPAAEVWPDPCELILEFCEDSRVDEEVDEVVSISVANSVVIIELTMVVDCWVIVKSDVYVAVGIRQVTVPLCWILSKSKLPLPPSSDALIHPVACCPTHCHKSVAGPIGTSSGIDISAF